MPFETVKFLLVDDSTDNLLALEGLLRRDGLELHKAHSASEALELLLVHEYALALLDVQMAGMDGFELAELMRGTERTRRVPIIFLTGMADDDRRRFRGYESGAIDYLQKPVDPQVLQSKAKVFFDLDQQRQALARQRDELLRAADRLAEAVDRLEAHRDNSPLGVLEFDAGFHITSWSQGATRLLGWTAADAIGRPAADFLMADARDGQDFARRGAEMTAGRLSRGMSLWRTRCRDGSVRDCEWYCSALLSPGGALISVNAQILDVTERRRAEETQRLLIAELNHRVKNTLAVVQAIAMQTLRHTLNPADFANAFTGRLQSVAQAHSMLSSTSWRGADLAELVRDQLRFGSGDEARVQASGPDIELAPQLALHIALILHELGTNARKYGALALPQGQVTLTWSIDDGSLRLVWAERGGPPVKAPTGRGFGTTLIEESAKGEGGSARVSYRADGIVWDVTLKLGPPAALEPGRDRATGVRPAPASASAATGAGSTTGAVSALTGRRFLVIEDEPLVAVFIANCLEDGGAEAVETAGSVEQAFAAIEAGRFDAAVLDGNLHGKAVDGIAGALTRAKVPFLFVSGYGSDGLPAAFRHAPALSKPFTQEQLGAALADLLPRGAALVQLKGA